MKTTSPTNSTDYSNRCLEPIVGTYKKLPRVKQHWCTLNPNHPGQHSCMCGYKQPRK